MPHPRPLAGQTVVVTRPRKQAGEFIGLLQDYGARVIAAPAIRILPPRSFAAIDQALKHLDSYDTLIFTSANGVERFFKRAIRVLDQMPRRPKRVYAIGPATASALAHYKWRGVQIPEIYEAGALACALGPVRGRRILIPRAEKARRELPQLLKKAGAQVKVVAAYRTEADPKGLIKIRQLARGNGSTWVTFTSGSTVTHFFSALSPRHARSFFQNARAASIGPITSATLRGFGVKPALEAPRYTAKDLAQALAQGSEVIDLKSLRQTLMQALNEAGKILLRHFGKARIRYKGRANLVTQADHASEERILKIILDRFPEHDFIAEERQARASGSDFLWVIDPLDGTTNYAHGFPVACVSIGLLHRKRPILGGVFDPFRNEMFLAEHGRGATLNGRPISVSKIPDISKALLLTGFAYDRVERSSYYVSFYRAFMERSHDVRRSGSASLDLAWTAAGRVEGFWEFNLAPWDVAAGMLLVAEAGGKVTDFSGRIWEHPKEFGRETLATNGRIHEKMLQTIKRYL